MFTLEKMKESEAFIRLKTACDKTIKDPSQGHTQSLCNVIGTVPSHILQQLQEYIMFPLELHLRRPDLGKESKRHIIDCLKELIHCSEVNSLKLFLRLYTLLFFQIFDSKKVNMLADVPEELKLSVVECATKLVEKSTANVVVFLYEKSNIPQLSQGIYMCVQMMQREKLRSLRVAAIRFVMTVTFVNDETPEIISVHRQQISNVLVSVFPGMLSGLHKVAIGDEKQGHLITVMSLQAWSRILVLMMQDGTTTPECFAEKIYIQARVSEKAMSKLNLVDNIQTKATDVLKEEMHPQACLTDVQKIDLLLELLTPLQQHSHWKVRWELVVSYHHILDKCFGNLKSVSIKLINVILKLCDDEMEEVSRQANEAFEMLSEKLREENGTLLLEILEENFYVLITKLPRQLQNANDMEQISHLSLLTMYLKLLGHTRLCHMLNSAIHLHQLTLSLIHVVELDTAGISLLEEYNLRELNDSNTYYLKRPWKQFKHFSSKDILHKVQVICKLLGQLGDLDILCDHLIDLFHTNSWQRKEVVLLLNEILLGGSMDNSEHILKNVLDIYLEPSTWYIPLFVQETRECSVTMGQAQSNVVLACLLVEGIGKMSVMVQSNFEQFLLRTLYVVLERAGSTQPLLSLAGTVAAQEMSLAGGYGGSIHALLAANDDYFSFHVTMKLRKVEENPGVLDVLSVAMRNSDITMLPLLQDIVDDVLLQSCDIFQEHHSLSFLQVFYTFFTCLRKWLPSEVMVCDQSQENPKENVFHVLDTLVQYHHNRLCCEWHENERERVSKEAQLPTGDDNELDDENEKNDVPNYVTMTESILKRCLHFLPSKDKRHKLLTLEILQEGIQILAKWENQLLPVVHLIWSPLVGRFGDTSDPLLLNCSFSLLHILASLAKDFIRSRTLKNVLPSLCQYLSDSANESKGKDCASVYRFTQAYKFQLKLLDKLGELAVHLCLQEKELHQLLCACGPYLSTSQPVPLQERCVKLHQIIAQYDEDCVWLQLSCIMTQVTSSTCNGDLKSNTELLLQLLEKQPTSN